MDTLDKKPFQPRKTIFEKLLEVASISNLTPEERVQYDESLRRYNEYKNTLEHGEKIGRGEALISVVKRMKSQNHSVSVIAAATGLSPEEIEKL